MQSANRNLSPQSARVSGVILILASLLSVVAMAHHPSVHATDLAQAVEQLKALAGLSGWVHGTLIALMLAIFYALVDFSLQRGLEHPPVRAGLIAYGAGVVAMIGAASVSGFITPAVPTLAPDAATQSPQVTAQLINLCMAMNRAWADIGAVAMSAGILAWSLDLLRSRGGARLLGGLGIVVGIAPAIALISGGMHLNVQGMTLVVALQGLWTIGVGLLLVLGRDP